MTATRIDYTNLFSEARTNVVELISNKSNVSDPLSSAAEYRKWIYAREPDVKANDFKGYPYIIIHPVDVDPEQDGSSADGNSKFISWAAEIEIVASDRGYGDKDGLGLSHMDTISNSIMKTLLDKTNRKTLRKNALYFTTPTTTAVTTTVIADELVYRRSIMVDFRGRIQVSA